MSRSSEVDGQIRVDVEPAVEVDIGRDPVAEVSGRGDPLKSARVLPGDNLVA